eukprot:4928276-Prymnesium_polylepis.1
MALSQCSRSSPSVFAAHGLVDRSATSGCSVQSHHVTTASGCVVAPPSAPCAESPIGWGASCCSPGGGREDRSSSNSCTGGASGTAPLRRSGSAFSSR